MFLFKSRKLPSHI
jgi:hypothetical protein